jgi:hypothetical protein
MNATSKEAQGAFKNAGEYFLQSAQKTAKQKVDEALDFFPNSLLTMKCQELPAHSG